MAREVEFRDRVLDASITGHCVMVKMRVSARRAPRSLHGMADELVTRENGSISICEVEFPPFSGADPALHASLIIARCREMFSEIKNAPWFAPVNVLYIGISEDVTTRWPNERKSVWSKRNLKIVR